MPGRRFFCGLFRVPALLCRKANNQYKHDTQASGIQNLYENRLAAKTHSLARRTCSEFCEIVARASQPRRRYKRYIRTSIQNDAGILLSPRTNTLPLSDTRHRFLMQRMPVVFVRLVSNERNSVAKKEKQEFAISGRGLPRHPLSAKAYAA